MATSNCLHLWKKYLFFPPLFNVAKSTERKYFPQRMKKEAKRDTNTKKKHNEKYVYKEMRPSKI